MSRNGIKSARSPRVSEDHSGLVEVRGDVAAIRNDFGRLLHDLKATGARSLKEGANSASASITQCVSKSREAATAAHKQLGTAVSKRPLTTIAVAAGVGVILSHLARR